MNEAKGWAATICFMALAAGLLEYLAPKGNMQRIYRLVTAAFAVLCLARPMVQLINSDLSSAFDGYYGLAKEYTFNESVNDSIRETVGINIEGLVAAELHRMGINYEKVSVVTDIDGEGRIVIERIVIILPEEYSERCGEAQSVISGALGIDTEVTAHGAGE